jgi:hypothetical protein
MTNSCLSKRVDRSTGIKGLSRGSNAAAMPEGEIRGGLIPACFLSISANW